VTAYLSFWSKGWEAQLERNGIGFAKDQGPLGAIAATQCLSKEKTRAKARAGGVPAEFEDYSSRKDVFGRWKMARSVGVGTLNYNWSVAPLQPGLNRRLERFFFGKLVQPTAVAKALGGVPQVGYTHIVHHHHAYDDFGGLAALHRACARANEPGVSIM